jgi:hypothetical protein
MPLEDLDLEFEDEEDLKKKKSESAAVVSGELSFSVLDASPLKSKASTPIEKNLNKENSSLENVKNIEDYRSLPQTQLPSKEAKKQSESREPQSSARDQFQDYKLDFLVDFMSDVKLLDYQVHQLLVRMHQKHPDLKPEIMAIKKALADFMSKKRK